MHRLLQRITFLWSFLAAFTSAAILVGYGQPPSSLIQNLHLGDCAAPCWIGIRPGETPIREAYDLLTDSFAMPPFNPPPYTLPKQFITLLLPIDTASQQLMPIQLGILDHLADEIRIPAGLPGTTRPESMPKLGDVFLLLGEPNCLRPWSVGFKGWSLIYTRPDGVIEVSLKGRRILDWQQHVWLLSLRAADEPGQMDGCSSPYGLVTWADAFTPNRTRLSS